MTIAFDRHGWLTLTRTPRRRWYSPTYRVTAHDTVLRILEQHNARPWWRRVLGG